MCFFTWHRLSLNRPANDKTSCQREKINTSRKGGEIRVPCVCAGFHIFPISIDSANRLIEQDARLTAGKKSEY